MEWSHLNPPDLPDWSTFFSQVVCVEAHGEGGQQNNRGRDDNADNRHHHVRNTLVEQILAARSQLARKNQLRRPDFAQADSPAHPLVSVGDFLDDVAGEAQFQQFAHRHAAAPFRQADHDAMRLHGAHDVA